MNLVNVRFKKLHSDAKDPVYKSEEAAGFDIFSIDKQIFQPAETAIVPLGIAMEIPSGYCLELWDRSGMGAKGIGKLAGLIDSDYRGEIKAVLHNHNSKEYIIEKGDRVIQGKIAPVYRAIFEEVKELSETVRGEGGFHSTGKK